MFYICYLSYGSCYNRQRQWAATERQQQQLRARGATVDPEMPEEHALLLEEERLEALSRLRKCEWAVAAAMFHEKGLSKSAKFSTSAKRKRRL